MSAKMKYKVGTIVFVGDEGYTSYNNVEEIEAVSEKQAIYLYEKKHGISYYESHIKPFGRHGAIYDPDNDYYRR